jgi:hypothetical protein
MIDKKKIKKKLYFIRKILLRFFFLKFESFYLIFVISIFFFLLFLPNVLANPKSDNFATPSLNKIFAGLMSR